MKVPSGMHRLADILAHRMLDRSMQGLDSFIKVILLIDN